MLRKELIDIYTKHKKRNFKRTKYTMEEVKEYINILPELRKEKIKNGTTRALLKEQYKISDGQAKHLIKIIKNGDKELWDKIDEGSISYEAAYKSLTSNKKPHSAAMEILKVVNCKLDELELVERKYSKDKKIVINEIITKLIKFI